MEAASYSTDGFYNISQIGNQFIGCVVFDWTNADNPNFPWHISANATNTYITGSDTQFEDDVYDGGSYTITMGGASNINTSFINRYGDRDLFMFYGTDDNPHFYIYGLDGGTAKYGNLQITPGGHFSLSSEYGTTILLQDEGTIKINYAGTGMTTFNQDCGDGVNRDLRIYGDKAVGSGTGSVNISYGDGANDYGLIEGTNGVRIDDLILDTAIPSAPVDGSCYFNAANQSMAVYYSGVWRYYEPN